ncbi:MAG TPA: dockerin, partial [Polyangia bacterium]
SGRGGAAGSGAAAGGGATGSGGAAGSPAPAWDWTGVIGTGQSLSVGGHGNAPAMPIGAATQRFHNLKLSLGSATVPPWDANSAQLSMVPLVETLRAIATGYPSPYPHNIYGESYHTAMADEITSLVMAGSSRDFVGAHTEVGEAGQGIAILQKGATDTGTTGRAYVASVFEVTAIARLAKAQNKSYGVGAIVLTHGEADNSSATFEADMVKLWQSYNQDLPALTGQTASIPMLLSQQHSAPTTAGSSSTGTLAQWRIGVDHPGDIICTGPKYQYAYVSDQTHLTNPDYERLGEKYGQVFTQRVVLGNAWQPLEPTSAERSGRVITVHFHVPAPPLAWDTTLPMPHQTANTEWAQGHGFEVKSGATRIAISSVALAADSVQITCATDLPASGLVVGYASTTDGTYRPNGTYRWGQLRDSDPFVGSLTRSAQPNYCVAFELAVP